MFESNLLSQINTRSPLPTFVEVEVVQSINSSLQRLFQFAHAALAEKSDLAARLQPWTDELFYVGVAVIERMLVFNADTTVAELLFELRRGRLSGPCAMPPRHAKPFRGEHLRFLLFGPAPAPSPELQSMGLVNSPSVSHSQAGLAKEMAQLASPIDNTPEIVGLHDATATPSMDVADSPGGADMHVEELYSSTHASYGHLRLQPLSHHQQIISLLLLTLKPYLEKKASEWYLRETDPSPDAVAIRQSYARRYPSRAELIRLLVRFVYPAYHVISESANFLFKFLFLLELTPFYSPWHRIFGIVVRRSTMKDSMLVSSGPARRACLLARMIVLLIVVGFRLLDFTRGSSSSSGSSPQAMGINEDLPIPPPPVWGVDAPLPIAEGSLPDKGCCPICRQRVQNASVCTSSGVVCCYPCLQAYLREHQSCPVTGKSASLENIRRVYEC